MTTFSLEFRRIPGPLVLGVAKGLHSQSALEDPACIAGQRAVNQSKGLGTNRRSASNFKRTQLFQRAATDSLTILDPQQRREFALIETENNLSINQCYRRRECGDLLEIR